MEENYDGLYALFLGHRVINQLGLVFQNHGNLMDIPINLWWWSYQPRLSHQSYTNRYPSISQDGQHDEQRLWLWVECVHGSWNGSQQGPLLHKPSPRNSWPLSARTIPLARHCMRKRRMRPGCHPKISTTIIITQNNLLSPPWLIPE